MTTTVIIPGGQAVIRDPEDMTERQRRTIRSIVFDAAAGSVEDISDIAGPDPKMRLTPAVVGSLFTMRDAAIVSGLVSWTREEPLPTSDTVLDLPAALYDALAKATTGLVQAVMTDFSPSPDPQSPTGGSNDSVSLSKDETELGLIPTSRTGGENTPTASSTT